MTTDDSQYRSSFAMVAVGWDRIALVGGRKGCDGEPLDSVLVWNLRTKKWSNHTLKERRCDCAAVAIQEKLYILGGLTFDEEEDQLVDMSSFEMLDLSVESDTAKTRTVSLPSMSKARHDHTAVIYDKTMIIVLGGFNNNDGGGLATVELFCTTLNLWTRLLPMPTARCLLAAGIAAGSNLLVAGGHNRSNTAEFLDLDTQMQWEAGTNTNRRRLSHCGTMVGPPQRALHMVVTGGCESSVEMYNFANDKWSFLPSLGSRIFCRQLVWIQDDKLVAADDTELVFLDAMIPNESIQNLYSLVKLTVVNWV